MSFPLFYILLFRLPHSLLYPRQMIHISGKYKKIVRQPIEIPHYLRIQRLFSSKSNDPALGTPTHRAGHMCPSSIHTSSRQYKRPNLRRRGIKSIYPALKRLPLPGESDYRAKSTTRLRRQISADIEKPILHTAQMLFLFRRTTRAASHFTEHGAEFVDRAIGLQAYTVLLRTLAADKRRRAVVAASGI